MSDDPEEGIEINGPMVRLPDGSGFMTGSLPLPRDHWLYRPTGAPPIPVRMVAGPERERMRAIIWAAGKMPCAARRCPATTPTSTPALIQNFVVGLIGYHTAKGLGAVSKRNNPSVKKSR